MIDDAHLRRSAAVAEGVRVALGGTPGAGWYDALAAHEEDAGELRRRAEADRQAALWLGGRR